MIGYLRPGFVGDGDLELLLLDCFEEAARVYFSGLSFMFLTTLFRIETFRFSIILFYLTMVALEGSDSELLNLVPKLPMSTRGSNFY